MYFKSTLVKIVRLVWSVRVMLTKYEESCFPYFPRTVTEHIATAARPSEERPTAPVTEVTEM